MKKSLLCTCSFKKILAVLLFATVCSTQLFAQEKVTIAVTTTDNALVFQTDHENRLGIIHFGKKLLNPSDYSIVPQQFNLRDDGNPLVTNNAYTASGTWSIVEPAIQVIHSDNN